jgi:hypothetical protein
MLKGTLLGVVGRLSSVGGCGAVRLAYWVFLCQERRSKSLCFEARESFSTGGTPVTLVHLDAA